MTKKITDIESYFWKNVKKTRNGCWLYMGGRSKSGYGRIHIESRIILAHRLSWKINRGYLPRTKLVCHTCDNPPCVNPDHLFLGTYSDNARDRERKNRGNHPIGEDHKRSKLKKKDVKYIRRCIDQKLYSQRYLARTFGVSRFTIQSIINHVTWRSV